jgi:hypothetical protein
LVDLGSGAVLDALPVALALENAGQDPVTFGSTDAVENTDQDAVVLSHTDQNLVAIVFTHSDAVVLSHTDQNSVAIVFARSHAVILSHTDRYPVAFPGRVAVILLRYLGRILPIRPEARDFPVWRFSSRMFGRTDPRASATPETSRSAVVEIPLRP